MVDPSHAFISLSLPSKELEKNKSKDHQHSYSDEENRELFGFFLLAMALCSIFGLPSSLCHLSPHVGFPFP